ALWAAKSAMRQSADAVAWNALGGNGREFTSSDFGRALDAEMTNRRELLHEVLGPLPFRPVAVDPAWRTSGVLLLAKGISGERASDRLPILAAGIQDAGCDTDDILAHLRGPGPHVRGCWALDLVLGKE